MNETVFFMKQKMSGYFLRPLEQLVVKPYWSVFANQEKCKYYSVTKTRQQEVKQKYFP